MADVGLLRLPFSLCVQLLWQCLKEVCHGSWTFCLQWDKFCPECFSFNVLQFICSMLRLFLGSECWSQLRSGVYVHLYWLQRLLRMCILQVQVLGGDGPMFLLQPGRELIFQHLLVQSPASEVALKLLGLFVVSKDMSLSYELYIPSNMYSIISCATHWSVFNMFSFGCFWVSIADSVCEFPFLSVVGVVVVSFVSWLRRQMFGSEFSV